MQLSENQQYDPVSKVLHWSMAILFLIQLLSSLAHYFMEDTAIEAFLWPSHKPLGFLLFVLVIFRIVWAVLHSSKRPIALNVASKLGHLAIYLVMFTVPFLALLRQFGSGRSFEPFGISVFSGFEGDKIEWMLDLGGLLHGELGWALFALAFGHIVMVVVHRHHPQHQDVLPRMLRGKAQQDES